MKTWTVYLSRTAFKQLQKLPLTIQDLADLAITDLESSGAKPAGWDVRKTAENEYQLRLTYRYRMRYKISGKHNPEIEIFYLGHRREAYR